MIRCAALLIATALALSAVEGTSLLPADPKAAFGFGDHTGRSRAETIPVEGQPFANGMRVTVVGKPEQVWQVNRVAVLSAPVVAGEVLELTCWMRGTAPDGATPQVRLIHQLKDKPWTAAIDHPITLTGTWTRYRFAWRAAAGWEGGAHRVAFFLGQVADQRIEFGPIELRSCGAVDPASLADATVIAPPKH